MLNQITDPDILPSSKDNWNPSDVWAVKISEKTKLTINFMKLKMKEYDELAKELVETQKKEKKNVASSKN